jgi:hypothetical protein
LKLNDAPTPADNYHLDRQLLDIFARVRFECCLWGKQTNQTATKQGPICSGPVTAQRQDLRLMVITNFAVALAIISAGLAAAAFYTLFVRFGRDWNNR